MSSGIWAAASGAISQVANLDNAANNLANLETPGFHTDRLLFRRALTGSTPGQKAHQSLEYSVARSASPDMHAGRVVPTGRDLDLAIVDDNAFFAVQTDRGIRYTRAGNMELMPDGVLAMPTGEAYVGTNRKAMTFPNDGRPVTLSNGGELIVGGEPTGQRLMMVSFADTSELIKEGGVLFRPNPGAGAPTRIDQPYLEVGALEMQTDKAFDHMTNVIDASRSFQMISQVIEAFKNVEQRAARDIVGR